LSAKNLIEAKRVVRDLLKKELSEKHITSKNICNDIAFVRSERTFCLVKYMDKILDNLSEVLPEVAKKVDWNRYTILEKGVFDRYLEQLESLKKEYPIKGTVVFVIRTGEVYMTSPYVLYGLDSEYGLSTLLNKKEIMCFPTIFLSVPEGLSKPSDEVEAQKRLSLISQVNAIGEEYDEDTNYYESEDFDDYDDGFFSFFSRSAKRSSSDQSMKFSELFPDDMRNVALNLLYEVSMSLKELTKEIKSIKKAIKGK